MIARVKTKARAPKAKVAPKLSRIVATARPRIFGAVPRGRLHVGVMVLPCAIGAASLSHRKREGDHATPAGRFRLIEGFFKPSIGHRPTTLLPLRQIDKRLGWCDDHAAPAYNRPIRLPSLAGHEKMWRGDGLYDLVIALDYNRRPRKRFGGSAIFLHCAREDFAPTEGCIALNAADLRKLLPRLARKATLIVR
jgi:L,D-peptidoglycan transpeptidase YkuD (ErfK/YbiS/YcfS/YnhG family)